MKRIFFLFSSLLIACNAFSQQQSFTTDSMLKKMEIVSARIYPNPARNKVIISVSGFAAGMIQLKIVGANGQVYRNDKRLMLSGNEEIVLMFSLDAGIYYVSLTQFEKQVKKKLVVH